MSNLDYSNKLWYLLNDFFYKNHCHNGFIGNDPDYYAFQKNKKIITIKRNDNDYLITYYKNNSVACKQIELDNISIKELEKELEQIISENSI